MISLAEIRQGMKDHYEYCRNCDGDRTCPVWRKMEFQELSWVGLYWANFDALRESLLNVSVNYKIPPGQKWDSLI